MAEKRKFEKTKEAKLTKKPKIVYTAEEEDWLVKNVLVYRAIIENKKTDGATNRDKDKAWAKVTSAFNIAPPGQERTQKSLREKYQKIKQTLKDRAFYFSKDAKQTGGGPTKKELRPLSEPMQQLAVLLAPSTLGLVATAGDSDFSTANQSALQYASRELGTSHGEAVTVEEIDIVDGSDFVDGGDVNAIFVHNENSYLLQDPIDVDDEPLETAPLEPSDTPYRLENTKENQELISSNEGAVGDCTWDRANPAKLRTSVNPLLQNSRRRKTESEQKQQHLQAKNKIELEILEGEKERYKFERERADLDRKRAAFDLERAELDRDRSAIEMERVKLLYNNELHQMTLQPTSNHVQTTRTSFTTAAAKKEYN